MVSPAQDVAAHSWGMTVDIDRCIGCQACVVACQAENNLPINQEEHFQQARAFEWIRVERYWEGEFPNVRAHFIPILCQHCENAPCEPVCPVYATYHNDQGMNVQVYNRCVGTRYCANGCPYQVRFFNYWEPVWPESLRNQLNPDVTVRSRGVMEKCSFCIQRIRRGRIDAKREGRQIRDGEIQPACVQACPTSALVFGDLEDQESKVSKIAGSLYRSPNERAPRKLPDRRAYQLLHDTLRTGPHVYYLARVDTTEAEAAHG